MERLAGYGSGSGDGSGYGYGDGSGYGDGDGYGYGDGSGYGSGYGDGYGDGSGYGDGDGYGYGDGSGYTYPAYARAVITQAIGIERVKELTDAGCTLAFWRSWADGRPANGGGGQARFMGLLETENGPLVACQRGVLHATLNPEAWKGSRLWVVALYPPVIEHGGNKLASLKREILAEIPNFYI